MAYIDKFLLKTYAKQIVLLQVTFTNLSEIKTIWPEFKELWVQSGVHYHPHNPQTPTKRIDG